MDVLTIKAEQNLTLIKTDTADETIACWKREIDMADAGREARQTWQSVWVTEAGKENDAEKIYRREN